MAGTSGLLHVQSTNAPVADAPFIDAAVDGPSPHPAPQQTAPPLAGWWGGSPACRRGLA